RVWTVSSKDRPALGWDATGERPKCATDCVEAAVVIQVVCFQVGDHSDLGMELKKPPVELVGLDDKEIAFSKSSARSEAWQNAANKDGRIKSGFKKDRRQHGGCRRFPVRPRHRERSPIPTDLSDGVGVFQDGKPK